MNHAQAGRVLTKIQAYDRRVISEGMIEAWTESLADIEIEHALTAVTAHFQVSTEWCMPAHIRRLAGEAKAAVRVAERRTEILGAAHSTSGEFVSLAQAVEGWRRSGLLGRDPELQRGLAALRDSGVVFD